MTEGRHVQVWRPGPSCYGSLSRGHGSLRSRVCPTGPTHVQHPAWLQGGQGALGEGCFLSDSKTSHVTVGERQRHPLRTHMLPAWFPRAQRGKQPDVHQRVDRWVRNMADPCSGAACSLEKEGNPDTCYDTDEHEDLMWRQRKGQPVTFAHFSEVPEGVRFIDAK